MLFTAHHSRSFILLLVALTTMLVAEGVAAESTADRVARLQRETAELEQRLAQKQAELASLVEQLSPRAESDVAKPLADESDAPKTKSPGKIELVEEGTQAPRWNNEISLGASFTQGNTDSLSVQLRGRAIRDTDHDKLTLQAVVDNRQTNDRTDTDRAKGEAQYDRNISERWYWLGRASGEYDSIIDLAYRAQLGPGVGYYFYRTDPFELFIESGPVYQAEETGTGGLRNDLLGRAAQGLLWKVTPAFRLFQNAEFNNNLFETNRYNFTVLAGAESDINRFFTLRLTAEDRYNVLPDSAPPGRKRNDLLLTTSLVWRF